MSDEDRERQAQRLKEQWTVRDLNTDENERNITNLPPEKKPAVTEQDDYSDYERSDGGEDMEIDSGKYKKNKSKPDEKDMCVFTGDGSLVPCPEEYLIKKAKSREAYRKRKALLAKKGKRSGRKTAARKSPARKKSTRKKSGRKRSARKNSARKNSARKRSTRNRK
jgi:hypothetical protein